MKQCLLCFFPLFGLVEGKVCYCCPFVTRNLANQKGSVCLASFSLLMKQYVESWGMKMFVLFQYEVSSFGSMMCRVKSSVIHLLSECLFDTPIASMMSIFNCHLGTAFLWSGFCLGANRTLYPPRASLSIIALSFLSCSSLWVFILSFAFCVILLLKLRVKPI